MNTKKQATIAAQAEADRSGVTLVVTHNPYAEYDTDRWGYFPKAASSIFHLETVVETIHPGENK